VARGCSFLLVLWWPHVFRGETLGAPAPMAGPDPHTTGHPVGPSPNTTVTLTLTIWLSSSYHNTSRKNRAAPLTPLPFVIFLLPAFLCSQSWNCFTSELVDASIAPHFDGEHHWCPLLEVLYYRYFNSRTTSCARLGLAH
jgi:hypothetical protein